MLMFWFTAPLICFRAKKLTRRQVCVTNGIFWGSFLSATYFKGWKIVSAVLLNGEIWPRELPPSPSTWPQFWPFWLNCAHFDMKDILPLQKLGFKCHSNPARSMFPLTLQKRKKEWLNYTKTIVPTYDCICDRHYICDQLLHLCLQQGWTSI